jgi:alginate O-acetyltransferase complex protein AlgI
MLFNSYVFLAFLVVTLAGYQLLSKRHLAIGKAWLVAASLFFYGWWKLSYLALLLGSVCGNFLIAALIAGARREGRPVGMLLAVGVAANLGLIGYFKYAGFFLETANMLAGAGLPVPEIILPLAISFFTFQQIAYLVDASRGEVETGNFLDYLLFVTFFPQLIAGPIVHHKEMLPQFAKPQHANFIRNVSIGVTIFVLGLFKKVGIADEIAPYADAVFGAAAAGYAPSLFEAWAGALAYTLQIYFDFSGYSDMAIGLGWMFGIRLPLNFFSPYKALNIIDFWRRWHITLSRFLRDYLYISLGGNRFGVPRRFVNLFLTMLLGGLWHGAGWTFVVWGGLHGFYLIVNHGWRALVPARSDKKLAKASSWLVTFVAVVVAWVFFRAVDFQSAILVLKGMSGANGVVLSERFAGNMPFDLSLFGIEIVAQLPYLTSSRPVFLIAPFLVICLALPNTIEFMRRYRPVLDPSHIVPAVGRRKWWAWRPAMLWSIIIAIIGLYSLLNLTRVSPFLYFQF